MTGMVLIFAMAVIVEGLVQYSKEFVKAVAAKAYQTAVTQVVGLICGVALCLLTGADLFGAVGIHFAWSAVGPVLTGMVVSRGANYVSDFVKRLQH